MPKPLTPRSANFELGDLAFLIIRRPHFSLGVPRHPRTENYGDFMDNLWKISGESMDNLCFMEKTIWLIVANSGVCCFFLRIG